MSPPPAPAISPLFELAMSVSAIGTTGPWNRSRWETDALVWCRRPSLLRALCRPGGDAPIFFLPPTGMSGDLDDEVAQLAFADVLAVQEALCRAAARPDAPAFVDACITRPRQALARLIAETSHYGRGVFARQWPLIRTQLATSPLPATAAGGHVVPSAFVSSIRRVETPSATHVIYPIPDAAAAFAAPRQILRWRQPLADLVGARRATTLMLLSEPASTAQLCDWMDLSNHAVTHHLKVLKRAGLVELEGRGETARWHRTTIGTGLVQSAALDGRNRHRRPPAPERIHQDRWAE